MYSLAGPSFNGAAGISYFITPFVAFELGLQYSHNKLNDKLNTQGNAKTEYSCRHFWSINILLRKRTIK
ncbi:MAG: hypothetical protein WKF59_11405 [Chitinophagaceae bacterium]